MTITTARVRLVLSRTFRIARGADDFRESVLLRIADGGVEGLGEAAPMVRYSQTAESAALALSSLGGKLPAAAERIDDTLSILAARFGRERAALAAVDMALYDLLGKRLGAPLYEVLGLNPERTPPTSYTIGIDSPDVIRERTAEAEEFHVLKIKMGIAGDQQIMEAVRSATDRPVRVDANEGWTRDEALEKIRWLEGQNVQFVEQPLPAASIEESRWLAERVSIPIFADESVHTAEDIPRLVGAFHGINIKLTKCGGIREAIRMIDTARACGMSVMLGCTVESSVGITAAAHLSPLVDYADLDGNLLLAGDPAVGVRTIGGRLRLPSSPGLGVALADDSVASRLAAARSL